MVRPRGTNKEVCQFEGCTHYQKEKGKDIIKRGKSKAGHQRYYCFHCNHYFVDTKGTPLYRRKLSERKIIAICKEVVETRGIRATARQVHVHRDTVMDLLDDLGKHALSMTNYLVHDLGLETYEVDELWSYIKKSRLNLSTREKNSLDRAKQLLQPA